MCGTRFEFWFATTAIVLIAAGSSLPVQSAPLTEAEISAAVPMPEPANLPPPTAADIARPHAAVSPTPAAPPRAAPTAVPNSTQPAAAPTVAAPEIATPPVAAPAAVAPAEAPVLTIDQRVAEKLRDLFGGRSDRIIAKPRLPLKPTMRREATRRFGSITAPRARAPRQPRPIWLASMQTVSIRVTIRFQAS